MLPLNFYRRLIFGCFVRHELFRCLIHFVSNVGADGLEINRDSSYLTGEVSVGLSIHSSAT